MEMSRVAQKSDGKSRRQSAERSGGFKLYIFSCNVKCSCVSIHVSFHARFSDRALKAGQSRLFSSCSARAFRSRQFRDLPDGVKRKAHGCALRALRARQSDWYRLLSAGMPRDESRAPAERTAQQRANISVEPVASDVLAQAAPQQQRMLFLLSAARFQGPFLSTQGKRTQGATNRQHGCSAGPRPPCRAEATRPQYCCDK